jgi:manganese/iron transport system permease protein/iron/zinc/copper transport system permease protein
VIAPQYGLIADWLRKRRMVPQQFVEDVLGVLLRAAQHQLSVAALMKGLPAGTKHIRRALKSLDKQGLLEVSGDVVKLTAAGEKEGRRLVRAHRLWESYLQHVGAPAAELHARAHHLEHVNDEAAVDYLDDKLGHPLRDPHGSEIPRDVIHLIPGATISASQLREGDAGTVATVSGQAAALGLSPGVRITAGPRLENGRVWTFVLPGGEEVRLDHHATDQVTVRLDDATAA